MAASPEAPKGKDAPVLESKTISLPERVKDEDKPFLERLLSFSVKSDSKAFRNRFFI
jgi:hypothetical protein